MRMSKYIGNRKVSCSILIKTARKSIQVYSAITYLVLCFFLFYDYPLLTYSLLTYYLSPIPYFFSSFSLFPFYTFMYFIPSFTPRALIAQSVEHGANNARVVGSSPTGSIFCFIPCYRDTGPTVLDFMLSFLSLTLTGDLAQW